MATTQSTITITQTTPGIVLDVKNLSSIHTPRLAGQGYATLEDILEHTNEQRIVELEEYLDAKAGGATEEQALSLLNDKDRIYFKKIARWITKWSNFVDDKIRSKYSVPFPDAPYAPQILNLATTYFVIHAMDVFAGGHIGNHNEDGEPTYYDYAMDLLRGITEGSIHLETEYTLPVKDANGNVIGTETVTIGITGSVKAQHYTENPLSIARQEREFGYAVSSRFGGSGYKQIGIRGSNLISGSMAEIDRD